MTNKYRDPKKTSEELKFCRDPKTAKSVEEFIEIMVDRGYQFLPDDPFLYSAEKLQEEALKRQIKASQTMIWVKELDRSLSQTEYDAFHKEKNLKSLQRLIGHSKNTNDLKSAKSFLDELIPVSKEIVPVVNSNPSVEEEPPFPDAPPSDMFFDDNSYWDNLEYNGQPEEF